MEETTFGWLSVVPPVLAIALALWTRQVFVSLALGILAGYLIISGFDPLTGTLAAVDAVVGVFGSGYNTRIILFTLVVGALIALIQANGGVAGFVDRVLGWLERTSAKASTRGQRKRVELMALATGFILFIESNISILTVGTLYRPVTDTLGVPREKLAYIADSGSAPSSVLIPFNAWGAYLAGLLADEGLGNAFGIVLGSVVFNIYPIAITFGLIAIILSGRDFGPMRKAEERGTLLRDGALPMVDESVSGFAPEAGAPRRAINMLLPIAALVIMVPVWLIYTGWSDPEAAGVFAKLQAGDGAQSVLLATTGAVLLALVLSRIQGIVGLRRGFDIALKGMAGMLPLAILMVLAFAIGSLCRTLGTGDFVAAQTAPYLSAAILPALVFVVGAFIAFSTGTSWGTFAILIPIVVPLAQTFGMPMPLVVAAAIGGGVFGDHASPISDTSIISSMAAASDHIDHVRTQLPYALVAGAVTVLVYLLLGVIVA